MKSRDEVVETLGSLTQSDRAWIIDRLSPAARSTLLGESPNVRPANNVPLKRSDSVDDALASVDADDLAEMLRREPAWVAHAILRQSRSWTSQVRDALPDSLRHQLKVLDTAGVEYSPALIESIERKMSAPSMKVSAEPKRSRFDELVAGIGAMLSTKRVNTRMRS